MMKQIAGFLTPMGIYLIITGLHLIVPRRKVTGYVSDEITGEKLKYHLNGRRVLVISVLLWIVAGLLNRELFSWLYTVRLYSLAGALVMGLAFSLYIVLSGPSTGKSFFAEFYFGRLKNPQFFKKRVDAKMWLYMIGAIMLELNALSAAAHHYMKYGTQASPGVFISAALISWFVFEYLTFEEVHLYTYDFFAERTGFKLGWGCLAFYPYFYPIALWATADLPDPGTHMILRILYVLLFFAGWSLARGANMQKFYFKTHPDKSFLGIKPETLSDGQKTLLVNGFWGLSRHINYLGEILMASGIILSVGYPANPLPWLYPLYYVALLFPRQMADDKRCALKYGPLWEEYESKVKYRIIPYIY
ncbi:MAG: DUF1295 domain-containing protein [Spirochaetales bacterium]|nr:DUF1295 domain-containing protein [Spirochaetales bacterium]